MALAPTETNAPLLIDPDAIQPFPISLQSLQLIAGGHPKRVKGHGRIKHVQLTQGHTLNGLKPAAFACSFQSFRIAAFISLNHGSSRITGRQRIIFYVKRKA
jgi:hypothetical protein